MMAGVKNAKGSNARGGAGRRDDQIIVWDLASREGLAGAVWRWRIEITLVILTAVGWGLLADAVGTWPALGVTVAAVAVVFGLPWSRRFVLARVWCLVTRHRLGVVFTEIRAVSWVSRRPPAIMRVRPTAVGERAVVWCRAGICFEDFERRTEYLAAACWARAAQVTRGRRFSHVVTIDVARRDPLTASATITPKLLDLLPRTNGNGAEKEVSGRG